MKVNLNRLKGKTICVTLDLERDYGELLKESCYEGLAYLHTLISFLKKAHVPLTCFVQGSLFESHPREVSELANAGHELELHSYSHLRHRWSLEEMVRGKLAYSKFMNKEPLGYRAPLGIISKSDYQMLESFGFKFDSSIFPSVRPEAYNNLKQLTVPHMLNRYDIVEFPFSVLSPLVRIPISLSYINLLGSLYYHTLKKANLPNFIVFNFHLQDVFLLKSSSMLPFQEFSLPYRLIFKRIYLRPETKGITVLDKAFAIFKDKGYSFTKMSDVYDTIIEED